MYEKTTPAVWKKNLKDGKYADATAAKRALGRVQGWTKEDKESAVKAANKHFGVEAKAAPKKAAKKATKKAAPKKAAAEKAAALSWRSSLRSRSNGWFV